MNLQSAIRSIGFAGALPLVLAVLFIGILSTQPAYCQVDTAAPRPLRPGERESPEAKTLREMVTNQQINRRKKEHEELLRQGDEALKLSEELETSFERNPAVTDDDLQKLQELEKIVSKIRDELGAKDPGNKVDEVSENGSENSARQSIAAAFKFLRSSTIKLVDELKKSTRFSISVAAIQASNAVVRFARFLRLKQ